jgi:restriction system protein
MAIPNYQEFMNTVLKVYAELGTETKIRDIETKVADALKISPEDRLLMVKSGANPVVYSRIHWASYYMYVAGLLEKPHRGFYKITAEGLEVLKSGSKINDAFLIRYKSFADFIERSIPKTKENKTSEMIEQEDPETRIGNAMKEMEIVLKDEILVSLKNMHPEKFEQVVVDLMVAMDYGVGKTTRYVGDGGIDGIIDEDELGLSKIYLQAKRYSDGKIQEKEMRDFMGALTDKPVSKGVFITTSSFSDKAANMAKNSKHHFVRLVDGQELAELMMKHNLGVRLKKGYEIKEIDNSFFEE